MLYTKEDLEPLLNCPACGMVKHVRYDFCQGCEAIRVEAAMKKYIAGYYRSQASGGKWVQQ